MAYKRIVYCRHAKIRLRGREFRRSEVRWLLARGLPFPVETFGERHRRLGREGEIRGRAAQVIYIEFATVIEIITVQWKR